MTNSGSAITIADDDSFRFHFGNSTNVSDLKDMISGANGTAAYTYINYDFRSWNGGKNDMNYYLNFTVGDATLSSATTSALGVNGHTATSVYNTGLVGNALLNAPGAKAQGFSELTDGNALVVNVQVNLISGSGGDTLSAGTSYPLTMDFVTYGQSNDGVEPVSYTHLTLPTIYSV